MGISANQARLMTLTARKHDLELRAQQISASKMITSLESQQHATDYSKALNGYSVLKQAEGVANNATDKYRVNANGTFTLVDSSTAVGGDVVQGRTNLINAVKTKLGVTATGSETLLNTSKANYDAAVASLSAQEKLLDMELTQINTEHNAVKTEYDAIKGLIGENVEKSFNVFG